MKYIVTENRYEGKTTAELHDKWRTRNRDVDIQNTGLAGSEHTRLIEVPCSACGLPMFITPDVRSYYDDCGMQCPRHKANRRLMRIEPRTESTTRPPTPISEPVIQPQPDVIQYGLDAITLFEEHTRETYMTAYGVQAPPFDPDRPIQTWFDMTDPGKSGTYAKLTAGGLETFFVSAAARATPNLPGRYVYPAPDYAPTTAYQEWPDGSQHPINPDRLMTLTDANALSAEIGGSPPNEAQLEMYPYVYAAGENRRSYVIYRRGQTVSAALLRQLRNANGVGAPGRWYTSDATNLRWTPTPQPDGADSHNYMPVPVRALLPNEMVVVTQAGPAIRRTDMALPGTVGFNATDRDMLGRNADRIITLLVQIRDLLEDRAVKARLQQWPYSPASMEGFGQPDREKAAHRLAELHSDVSALLDGAAKDRDTLQRIVNAQMLTNAKLSTQALVQDRIENTLSDIRMATVHPMVGVNKAGLTEREFGAAAERAAAARILDAGIGNCASSADPEGGAAGIKVTE